MKLYETKRAFQMTLKKNETSMHDNEANPCCEICVSVFKQFASFHSDSILLYRSHLDLLLEHIDKTLNKEITEEHHLHFENPTMIDCSINSPISFLIHCGKTHDEDFWEFQYESYNGYGS